VSSFSKVLLVEYATFTVVFLKVFVMALVSLPMYVNFDHCVFIVPCTHCLLSDIDFRKEVLYPLLYRICCIMLLFFFCILLGDNW